MLARIVVALGIVTMALGLVVWAQALGMAG